MINQLNPPKSDAPFHCSMSPAAPAISHSAPQSGRHRLPAHGLRHQYRHASRSAASAHRRGISTSRFFRRGQCEALDFPIARSTANTIAFGIRNVRGSMPR